MVLQIGVCDDEAVFLENLKEQVSNLLEQKDVKYTIYSYNNGNKLLEKNKEYVFNLLFLDIEMPQINGIEIAEKVRKFNPYVNIIFITNRDDLVFESLKYKPFRFIRKHFLNKELPEAIDSIVENMKNENQYFTISFNNSSIQIKISEIIYLESYRHDIYIHCTDNKYRIKNKLTKLEEEFEAHGFIRVHSGYLVNYQYIYSVDKTTVLLSNRESIPLSRHRAETVKQKLQLFSRGTV